MSNNWIKLKETRAADRITMARAVVALCEEKAPNRGLATIIFDYQGDRKRVAVKVSLRHSLSVTVCFAGNSSQGVDNTFVLSWYFEEPGGGRPQGPKLCHSFAQNVNSHHQRKATDVVIGFPQLMALLRKRFEWAEDGSAFIKPASDRS